MNLLAPINDLFGVAEPDPLRGYADNPALAAWLANAPAGRLVTPAEHNTMVASLAWAQLMLARPPSALPVVNGVRTPYVLFGNALVLGASLADYVPGDIVVAASRPAGDVALPVPALQGALPTPVPPLPPIATGQTVTITDAERRAAFDLCRLALEGLALTPEKIVVVPAGVAPAGIIGYIIGAGVVIAVAWIGSHAAYNAHVEAEAIRSLGRVEEVRIREQGVARQVEAQAQANTAQVAAQVNARVTAQAQRLATIAATGRDIAPGPVETDPLRTQPIVTSRPVPPPSADSGVSLGVMLGVGGLAVAGAGAAYVSAARWADKRAVRGALLRGGY
jgi:hypothetical protein